MTDDRTAYTYIVVVILLAVILFLLFRQPVVPADQTETIRNLEQQVSGLESQLDEAQGGLDSVRSAEVRLAEPLVFDTILSLSSEQTIRVPPGESQSHEITLTNPRGDAAIAGSVQCTATNAGPADSEFVVEFLLDANATVRGSADVTADITNLDSRNDLVIIDATEAACPATGEITSVTLGQILDGEFEGDLVLSNVQVPEEPEVPEEEPEEEEETPEEEPANGEEEPEMEGPELMAELYGACGEAESDEPHQSTVVLGMPNVTQFTNGTSGDNMSGQSCGPASGASVLKKYDETAELVNATDDDLVDELRRRMMTGNGGTRADKLIYGLLNYTDSRGLAGNFTATWYWNSTRLQLLNGTVIDVNGTEAYSFLGSLVRFVSAEPGYGHVFSEVNQSELVIVLYRHPDGFNHYVAVDDLNTEPNSDGSHNVSFMDPWTGGTSFGTLDADGRLNLGGASARLLVIAAISER